MLQHQTGSPMHPRANGFVECMVDTAKMFMGKAGKEGKPWISGLLKNIIILQSGDTASPMELMMQRKPRATALTQLPSNIATHVCRMCAESSSRGKAIGHRESILGWLLVH